MKINLICISIFLLIWYCSEMPESPHFIDYEIESRVDVKAAEGMDTLRIFGNYKMDFTVNLNGHIVDFTKLVFNDSLIYDTSNAIIKEYVFNSKNNKDGWYSLKYIIRSHLPPDSLRSFSVWFDDTTTFAVLIDNDSQPLPITITSAQPINGKLQLKWTRYEGAGFQQYVIYRTSFETYQMVETISNPAKNYWRDPEYLAGNWGYFIQLKAKDQAVDGDKKRVVYNVPELSLENIDNHRIELHWDRCLFDSTFGYYVIHRTYQSPEDLWYTSSQWKIISNIDETMTLDTDLIFGDLIFYELKMFSKSNDGYLRDHKSIYFGFTTSRFETIFYSEQNSLFYLIGSQTNILDANTFEVLSTHSMYPKFSIDGKNAYIRINNTQLAKIEPLTMETIKVYNVQEIIGNELTIGDFAVANDNRVLVMTLTYEAPTYYYYKCLLLDLEKAVILAETARYPNNLKGSADGNYWLVDKSLLHYQENQGFVEIQSVENDENFCFYPQIDGYILTDNSKIQVRSLPSNQVVVEFNIENNLNNPNLDQTKELLGGQMFSADNQNSHYRIYDLKSGNLVHQTNIVRYTLGRSNYFNYWFKKNTLFSRLGYYLPLDLSE